MATKSVSPPTAGHGQRNVDCTVNGWMRLLSMLPYFLQRTTDLCRGNSEGPRAAGSVVGNFGAQIYRPAEGRKLLLAGQIYNFKMVGRA